MKVAQSWDDGVVDDVRLTELLRRHQARATFNLNPGLFQRQRSFGWMHGDKEVWRLGRDELSTVYAGFEIANHSLNHPNLPDLPPETLDWEIRESRRILQDWFQQPVRWILLSLRRSQSGGEGGGARRRPCLRPYRDEHEPVFPPADPFEFGVSCRFVSPAFWTRYEQAKIAGGVFCFWGHSYELTSEAMWADLEDKLTRISADPAAEWVNIETLFAN